MSPFYPSIATAQYIVAFMHAHWSNFTIIDGSFRLGTHLILPVL